MKTKELIKFLQEADPIGETEVSVGNVDISFVEELPAYYDGPQQVLTRDAEGYLIGGKYNRSGRKVQIHTAPLSELVWDRREFTVDYSDLDKDRQISYKENHDKIREDADKFTHQTELEYFTEHIKKRAVQIMEDDTGSLDEIIKDFFIKHINPYAKFPDDIPWVGESYITRRNKQWEREVDVVYSENGFEIKKKEENNV